MNSFEDLINHGFEPHTAQDMISTYTARIGTTSGIYKIEDVEYDYTERGKMVTLRCTNCGKSIKRLLINGRNKWSELIKHCPCEKELKAIKQKEEFEKILQKKKEDYLKRIGETHGSYTIKSLFEKDGRLKYRLQCNECNEIWDVSANIFESIKSFHCTKYYRAIKYDESYIGKKKNFLTVKAITKLPNGHRAFLCKCDCGDDTTIEPSVWEKEIVKSCGCMQCELLSQSNKTHGLSKERLYHVWHGMIARCYNSNSESYDNYGGRGIRVCDEWLGENGVEKFFDWAMANGYDENAERGECTIDRIDVNGNYEPSNCRWATMLVQANNKRPANEWRKRKPKTILFMGEERILSELYEEYNTSQPAVKYRMTTHNMTFEEALTAEKMATGRPRKEICNATKN